nr:helix-turn-helix transcriptional regulator [Streptomyces sp. NBC_00899]
MLEAIGLTPHEAEVYEALVRFGPSTLQNLIGLGVLGGESGGAGALPRPQWIREVADGLAAKGLLTMPPEPGGELIASPPHLAGEALLLTRHQELLAARAWLARLAEEYRGSVRPGDLPVEFTPSAAVAQQVDQLQRGARAEVLMFDAPPYLSHRPAGVPGRPAHHTEIERLEAGVRYRTVHDRAALARATALSDVLACVRAGRQARVTSRVPLKMLVVDRELAMLPAVGFDPALDGSGCVLVHRSPLLDGIIELFERVWAEALPLRSSFAVDADAGAGEATAGAGHGTGSDELGDADVRLLTLLLSGLTDEVIARQLDVGRRTVLRRVRGLMDRAGVSTRMQLGWYASRHDWLRVERSPGTPGNLSRMRES